jgi:hypothetical protein
MSAQQHHHGTPSEADLVELVEELVEAHLDTVQIGAEADHEWSAHVRYLQALVRASQARLASLVVPAAASARWAEQ